MALLSFRGFDTPSLPAQGEQRLPPIFNIQRDNARLKEEVARWAEALAPFVYNAYPAMSLTAIAMFLASAEARSSLAGQLTDRHANALLERKPPRDDANWRSIYNKLLHAIKQGRLQNCPRPKTRTKITKS
jgi:hypothetical protein